MKKIIKKILAISSLAMLWMIMTIMEGMFYIGSYFYHILVNIHDWLVRLQDKIDWWQDD